MQCKFSYRIELLKKNLKEKGIGFTIRRVMFFSIRPLTRAIKRSLILIEIFYGILPNLRQKIFPINSGLIKFPESELVEKVRYFWYSNTSGSFDLEGEKISRKDIFIYGGPNPKFTCLICQKTEWLSRVRQKNLFIFHNCSQSKECQDLCQKQGDELWTNLHQNFDFSVGCDIGFPAARGLLIMPEDKNSEAGGYYHRFQKPGCDQWMLVFLRRLAFSCQFDVVRNSIDTNWKDYDFIFMPNTGNNRKFPRPDIPIILYGHDFWPIEDKGYQWVIDWVQPDILLTPYPGQWKEYFKLPSRTKVVFYPFFDSLFFARPNLTLKKIDLLTIGSITSFIYGPRISLNKKISQLANRYNIEFSHSLPLSASWSGGTYRLNSVYEKPIYYLNKWSEYLGRARYVIFGKMKHPVLVSKYYEVLGSGAIPIFPEVPDLKLLGIKPFEHYIPLSEVEGNNERLSYLLDRYENFKHIAENAVKWYKNISDKMIFEDFEELIRQITNFEYPKRLL